MPNFVVQVTRGTGWGMGELGEGGQKAQTFSYKINSEDIRYSMVTIVNNTYYTFESFLDSIRIDR